MSYLSHRARQSVSTPTQVAVEEHLEQFIRSLQVRLESDIVNQSLVIVEQRFLLDGFRFLALTWRLDRLTGSLG